MIRLDTPRFAPLRWRVSSALFTLLIQALLKIVMSVRCLAFLIAIVMSAGSLQAQTASALLRGQVSDPSGRAINAALVTITHIETGAVRSMHTDGNGHYTAPALIAGSYGIEVEKAGFNKLRAEGITLAVGEQALHDFELPIGNLSDEITVTAPVVAIEADSPAQGTVIPNNYIVNLPLDGRNFIDLALLAPGVFPGAQGSAGSERGRFAFHSNGGREDANSYLFDGVYAIDPVLNSFSLTPSVDAIQEFRIITSNSDAGFGRQSGGQIAILLKRGGNDFHGSLYEFFRNDVLDARNFFTDPGQPTPKLRRNQFGFSVGGPLRKNDSFFFADYEGLRERRAITRTTNVPAAAERMGDFSGSLLPPPIDFTTFQPYPNSQLPFRHPIGANIADLYPLPNRNVTGQNYVGTPTLSDRSDRFDLRFDQSVGAGGTLTGRYSVADRDLFEPFAAASFSSIPGFGNDVPEQGQNLMVGETHSIGAAWINEFRFGYNRVSSGTFHENRGRSINQEVGLPDFATRPRDLGLSFINVTGFSSLGDEFNNPQDSKVDSFQVFDTVNYTRGNHLVQFGFETRWMRQDAFRDVQARGLINFTNFAFTQNALADLLLGLPTLTGGAVSDNPQALRTGTVAGFVHDSWRVRKDLTLSLGLRYEFNSPARDANDQASVFDAATQSIVRVGENGVPRAGYESDKNNFAPRFGLAWSPFGTRKTVIRAGYGVYYNFSPLAPGQGIYFNQPFFNLQLFFPSQQGIITLDDPWPGNLQAPLPPSAFTYDRDLRTGYTQQWSSTIETDFGQGVVLEVGYFGSKGTKLLSARDINQADASPARPNLRPNPFFLNVEQIEAGAGSIYHSLQTRLQCRLRGGLTGLFSYTWAKSIDNASAFFPSSGDANYPQDSNNTAAERALSSFDLRHRFAGSFAYDLPFGRGRKIGAMAGGFGGALISGWQMNGVMVFQSGQPFTVALPGEFDNSNTGIANLGFGAGDRPNVTGNPVLSNPDPGRWFNTEAFGLPSFGTFGNAGRNIVSGPPLRNLNVSLLKDTPLGEAATLQFRAEFFNLTNTPNFGLPNIFFGTPGFGRVLAANDGREIQFGMKLLF